VQTFKPRLGLVLLAGPVAQCPARHATLCSAVYHARHVDLWRVLVDNRRGCRQESESAGPTQGSVDFTGIAHEYVYIWEKTSRVQGSGPSTWGQRRSQT